MSENDLAERIQRLEDIIAIQRHALEAAVKAITDGESFQYLDAIIYPKLLAALKLTRLKS